VPAKKNEKAKKEAEKPAPRIGRPLSSGNPDHPIVTIRLKLGLTQTEMAASMGLGMSAYQDLEADASKVRIRHQQQAERVAFFTAAERKDPTLIPNSYRRAMQQLKGLV
jgi:hypothetical protein